MNHTPFHSWNKYVFLFFFSFLSLRWYFLFNSNPSEVCDNVWCDVWIRGKPSFNWKLWLPTIESDFFFLHTVNFDLTYMYLILTVGIFWCLWYHWCHKTLKSNGMEFQKLLPCSKLKSGGKNLTLFPWKNICIVQLFFTSNLCSSVEPWRDLKTLNNYFWALSPSFLLALPLT